MSTMMHCAPYAVHQAFEKSHVCCGGADVVWIVYVVSSCSESGAIFFFLVWFHVAAKASICYILPSFLWDLVFVNEVDGICSSYSSIFESLC